MGHMTIAPDVATALGHALGPTELRDQSGRVVGFFNPSRSSEDAELIRLGLERFDLDEVEERYRREKGTGKPTAAVLEHLRSLVPDQ